MKEIYTKQVTLLLEILPDVAEEGKQQAVNQNIIMKCET